MEQMKSKVVFENLRSSLRVETDGEIIALISNLSGYSDTTIYLYQDELEKALEFVKEINNQK